MPGSRKGSKGNNESSKVKDNEREDEGEEDDGSCSTNKSTTTETKMAAQILKNNTDLTEQIANAIQFANTLAALTPNVNSAAQIAQLQQLQSRAAGITDTAQQLKSQIPAPIVTAPNLTAAAVAPIVPTIATTQPAATTIATHPPVVYCSAAPPPAAAAVLLPPAQQDADLLSLLTSNNFLSPSELALPTDDLSVFLPTPFAPGQSASTLQQQKQKEQKKKSEETSVSSMSTRDSTGGSTNNTPAVTVNAHAVTRNAPVTLLAAPLPAPALVSAQILPVPASLPVAAAVASLPVAAMATVQPQALLSQQAMQQAFIQQYCAMPPMLAAVSSPPTVNPLLTLMNNGINPFAAANPNLWATGIHGLPPAALLQSGLAGFPSLAQAPPAGIPLLPGMLPAGAVAPSTGQGDINPAVRANLNANQPNNADTQSSYTSNVQSGERINGGGLNVPMKSREARWVMRYNELLEFRRKHGHCRVPHGYSSNRKLSWWVMNQRAQYTARNQGKKSWLTDERIQLLDGLGFIWTPHVKGARRRESDNGQTVDEEEETVSGTEEDSDEEAVYNH